MVKVFISWSGETSHTIAVALRDWLPTLLPSVSPWVSSEDISKGDRWNRELAKQLSETSIGIICLDPTNILSPWLNFEAGALSKSVEFGKVFPLLFGISSKELQGPLSQFQVTSIEKEDMLKLVMSMNRTLKSNAVPIERLYRSFEITWPGIKKVLESIDNFDIEDDVFSDIPTEENTSTMDQSTINLDVLQSEIDVLKTLSQGEKPLFSIATKTNFSRTKAERCLQRLEERGYTTPTSGSYWSITPKGMDFLLENDL
jgi:predicted transcriptional regulator